jgi:hypothetical protein
MKNIQALYNKRFETDSPIVMKNAVASLGIFHANYGSPLKRLLFLIQEQPSNMEISEQIYPTEEKLSVIWICSLDPRHAHLI